VKMRVGLISDTHDDIRALGAAVARFREAQVQTVLHAGDVTTASTLKLLHGFDVWLARGNMDHDPRLALTVAEYFGAERLARVHTLNFDGVQMALMHGDSWQQLTSLIRAATYAYVIHGHTHVPRDETIGTTRIINPGTLASGRGKRATCAIVDLATGELQWIEL